MANLITSLRLILVFAIGIIALYASPLWQMLNIPLISLVIISDALDGMVARLRHEESVFGAVFDIAADRIVEIVLWLILAKLNQVSIWIAIIFAVRGILVDSLRTQYTVAGKSPFSIMQTTLGKFLVANRGMRFFYGMTKFLTFTWLLLMIPYPKLWPYSWVYYYHEFHIISNILIYFTLAMCLIRGLPVLVETLLMSKISTKSLNS